MTLTLSIDVFFCAKARRAINDRPVLRENLKHEYCDEYSFKTDDEFDCFDMKATIDETFAEANIPNDEYTISIN